MSHHDRVLRGPAVTMYPRAPRPPPNGSLLLTLDDTDFKDKEKASLLQKFSKALVESKRRVLGLGRSWLAYCNLLLAPVHKQRQVLTSRYRELSSHTRERILFLFSTLLGTALFLGLFECLFVITLYHLEQVDAAFVLSYTGSYLVSIVWQHALNRYLVFPSGSYCVSLIHTYLIYSLSYAVVATLGTLLLKATSIHPRTVTALTLPISGAINYYFLSTCLETTPNRPASGRPKNQKCLTMGALPSPSFSSTLPSPSMPTITPLSVSLTSFSRPPSFVSTSLTRSAQTLPVCATSESSLLGPVLSPFPIYPFSPALLPPYSGISYPVPVPLPPPLFPQVASLDAPASTRPLGKDGNSFVL